MKRAITKILTQTLKGKIDPYIVVEAVEAIENADLWRDATKERPTESGYYLCSADGWTQVLHYSVKHDAFNAFDELHRAECDITVQRWMEIPK